MSYQKHSFLAILILASAASTAMGQSFLERLENAFDVQPAPPPVESKQNERGYLGLLADLNDRNQIVVVEVDAGGPAEKAGILRGDRILQIAGRATANLDSMAAALDNRLVGDTVEIKIARDETVRTVNVVLDRQASALEQVEGRFNELPPPPPPAEASRGAAFLGVRTEPVTPTLRARYGLMIDRGAVVVEVTPDSPAEISGIPVGSAIVGIDRRQVSDPNELARAVRSIRAGTEVEIEYYRGRQLIRSKATLGSMHASERPLLLGGGEPPLETPPPPTPLPGDGLLDDLPRFDDQRPAGRLLNRVIEGVRQPNQPLPTDVPPATIDRRVETLEATIDRLEQRVAELEAKLRRLEQ